MIVSLCVYLLYFIQCSYALNNGLGRTPQMGKIEGKDSIRRKELCEKYCLYGNVRFYRTFDCTFFLLKGGVVGIIFFVISMKR
jgi:hypothetical protein